MLVADRMNKRVEGSVDGSYGRLAMWGRWMNLPVRPSQTPFERGKVFVEALPETERPLRVLIDEFVRRQFSSDKKENIFVSTIDAWKELRPIFIRTSLKNRFRRDQSEE